MSSDPRLTKRAREAIVAGIPENELFTPILKSTRKRLVMRVKADQRDKITRGPGHKGYIIDELTGKAYRVEGRECALPNCWCDAEVEEVCIDA